MPPTEPLAVEKPPHPLYALTTFELRDYRRQLERAVTFADENNLGSPEREVLRARLDAVLAEQDERARLARA